VDERQPRIVEKPPTVTIRPVTQRNNRRSYRSRTSRGISWLAGLAAFAGLAALGDLAASGGLAALRDLVASGGLAALVGLPAGDDFDAQTAMMGHRLDHAVDVARLG
jgi:hypothetical protein